MSDITVTGTFYPSALDLSAKSEIDVFLCDIYLYSWHLLQDKHVKKHFREHFHIQIECIVVSVVKSSDF